MGGAYPGSDSYCLLQELGLVLFLAKAGIVGGASLGATVSRYGAVVFLTGALITLTPLGIAYAYARKGLSSPKRRL